jgi:hypothetical protein
MKRRRHEKLPSSLGFQRLEVTPSFRAPPFFVRPQLLVQSHYVLVTTLPVKDPFHKRGQIQLISLLSLRYQSPD